MNEAKLKTALLSDIFKIIWTHTTDEILLTKAPALNESCNIFQFCHIIYCKPFHSDSVLGEGKQAITHFSAILLPVLINIDH